MTEEALSAFLSTCTISQLQARYLENSLKIAEVVSFFLERIEKENPRLNAVIAVNDNAIETAHTQDALSASAKRALPLFGVPLLIKDNIETIEHPTTAGSLVLKDNWTHRDAEVIANLREAGAILLGKANLSEWANFRSTKSTSGWSAVGGQTRNPLDTDRSTSGSSSGSAAAVAANLCVAALGTETLGSVVSPSSLTGIVGFKPGIGLVSQHGIVPISASQDTVGPMTKNVEDTKRLFEVMSGARAATEIATRGDTRIGVMPFSIGVDKEIDQLFEQNLKHLEGAGFTVERELEVQIERGLMRDFLEYSLYEFKHYLNAYFAALPNELSSLTLADVIAFNEDHADEELKHFGQEIFLQAQEKGPLETPDYQDILSRIGPSARRIIDHLLNEYQVDVLVSPTDGPAWPIDYANGDKHTMIGIITGIAAIAGYPHITLPQGNVANLPIGLSLAGGADTDAALLSLAGNIEQLLNT